MNTTTTTNTTTTEKMKMNNNKLYTHLFRHLKSRHPSWKNVRIHTEVMALLGEYNGIPSALVEQEPSLITRLVQKVKALFTKHKGSSSRISNSVAPLPQVVRSSRRLKKSLKEKQQHPTWEINS